MRLLDGQIALITGAGSGIGRAIAIGFAKHGANVLCVDKVAATANAVAIEIVHAGGSAQGFSLDVSDRECCMNLAGKIKASVGDIDILVNNAGVIRRTPFGGDTAAVFSDWEDVMSTNLTGSFNITKAFLSHLRISKGRVVNIGSIQSFMHVRTPSSPAYTSSKHGLLGLTRALAAELGKEGVRVNAIAPGMIETALNEEMRNNDFETRQTFIEHTPLGRAGRPEDIVGPALFLASALSEYVTGSVVTADGGYRCV